MQDFNTRDPPHFNSSGKAPPPLFGYLSYLKKTIHDFVTKRDVFVFASKDYFSELDDQLENILDGDLPDEAEVDLSVVLKEKKS